MFRSILCGLLLNGPSTLPAADTIEVSHHLPEIIVQTYNYAGAAEDLLARAQLEAAKIFLEVGVRISWLPCTPTPQGLVPAMPSTGLQVIALMICPETMLPRSGLPPGIFGFALLQPDQPARYARLHYHRVTELADGRTVRLGVLLGAMMAHEIGHLLLGGQNPFAGSGR
jgi:hypothetical protein